jgi:alanine-glyoxylate transaminase/serine-glyoxylate transaminase/serine-pyruvate transaminase
MTLSTLSILRSPVPCRIIACQRETLFLSMETRTHTQPRILLGPGPSMVSPRVLEAMAQPPIGYLDPELFSVLNEIQAGLRGLFRTGNEVTLALPGTGMSGMECALNNLIEPGDRVLIGVHGFFGARMVEIARRCGAEVHVVEAEWGTTLQPEPLQAVLTQHARWKLIACVHAETSTGVEQPIVPISELAKQHEALLVVDAVTSLGGIPVEVDGWGIDVCYSATQKCVGAPPGLAPITFSPRAWEAVQNRKIAPHTWYLDLRLLMDYWGEKRVYHHTTPISLMYGLHTALQLIEEEGLESRWERHRRNAVQLWQGLAELGLQCRVPEEHRLPTLTPVEIPPGVDDVAFRKRLLNEFNLEIGGGLGAWKGQVWRIGLMGYSSCQENMERVLEGISIVRSHTGN